jgi:Na+/proline symporter
MSIYLYIALFGFAAIIFLTLRDIRIFHRTRIESYRKGALRGMIAGALAWVGMLVTTGNPSIGLTIVLVAVYLNGKGKREDVFGNAPLAKRVLGETTIKK